MNQVIVSGQLINTPEVQQITDKFKKAELLISVKRPKGKYTKPGDPDFDIVQVEVTGEKADFVSSALAPGNNVFVIGEVSSREYKERYFTSVRAKSIEVVQQLEYVEQRPSVATDIEAERWQLKQRVAANTNGYQSQPSQPFVATNADIPF